jgi:hypothetical protein
MSTVSRKVHQYGHCWDFFNGVAARKYSQETSQENSSILLRKSLTLVWGRYPRNLIPRSWLYINNRWLKTVVFLGRCFEIPDWDSNPVDSVDCRYLAVPYWQLKTPVIAWGQTPKKTLRLLSWDQTPKKTRLSTIRLLLRCGGFPTLVFTTEG